MNQITIIGRLGQDPEVRHVNEDKMVCNFSVATSEGDRVEWHRVSVWDKTAENCARFLTKGSQVAVVGRMTYRTYENKDGVKMTAPEIKALRVEFLGGKSTGEDLEV